jgi:hypothetical protein
MSQNEDKKNKITGTTLKLFSFYTHPIKTLLAILGHLRKMEFLHSPQQKSLPTHEIPPCHFQSRKAANAVSQHPSDPGKVNPS